MCFAGTGVSVFSLHPGVVQSDLWRHQHQCIQVAVKIFKIFTKTTVEGAQTTIYCAVEPNLEGQSGGYFRYEQHFGPFFLLVVQELFADRHRAAKTTGPLRTFCVVARFESYENVRSNATQHVMAVVCPCVCAQRLCPRDLLEVGL